MIRVKILCPAAFHTESVDESGYMLLNDGAVLRDVLKSLNIKWPPNDFINYSVNGLSAGLDKEMCAGDEIVVFSVVSGG